MADRIPVFVYAADHISEAGIGSQLRGRLDVTVVGDTEVDAAMVAIVVVDEVDEEAARAIRAVQRNGCPRVVVVASRLGDAGLMTAIEAGACGVLRRTDAVPDKLAALVVGAATGDGSVPPDLLGRLLHQVGQLQRQVLGPQGLNLRGMSEREIDVLRLVADGHDTGQIARTLCWSERTVKNVIHDVTTRMQLRNRSHAIAYALREGLI